MFLSLHTLLQYSSACTCSWRGDSPDRWLSRPKHTSVARTDGRTAAVLHLRVVSRPPLPRATMPLAGGNRVNNSPSLRGSNLFVTPRSRSYERPRPSNTIERRYRWDGGGVAKYGGGRCMHRSRSLPSLLFGGEQFSPSPIPIIPRFRPSLRPTDSNEMNPSKRRKAGTTDEEGLHRKRRAARRPVNTVEEWTSCCDGYAGALDSVCCNL